MTNTTYKKWYWIHKWSSLICTLFLFLLCLTGLPLIFHHEIDEALGNHIDVPEMSINTPAADLDKIVMATKTHRPNDVIQYIIWENDEPNVAQLIVAEQANTHPDKSHTVLVDNRNANILGMPAFTNSVIFILLKLHTDLFLGLAGKLFLGGMGFLFVISIISGVVVYGPQMRKLKFGTVRQDKTSKVKWLDRHNLMGISILAWTLVVGGTGFITSLADLAVQEWRENQLNSMVAAYQNQPALKTLASVEQARRVALETLPEKQPSFIAFPGTNFSSPHHYTFFMAGTSKLSSYLLTPVLIDGQTAEYKDKQELPWYFTLILTAKPLHFGDYAGLPLKIIWALLDIITLVILGSGLYLWWIKRKVKT